MFTLKKLNVVRVVEDEFEKSHLLTQGFELIEQEIKKVEEEAEEIKKGKATK